MESATDKTAKCLRCGRTLRAAASVRRQYGRGCYTLIRLAALADAAQGFKDEQITKARNLIANGGLTPANREHVWFAEASDGSTRYQVNTAARLCECKAGQRALRCYHLLAALLTEAIRRLALAA